MPKLSPDNHLSGSAVAAYLGHSPWSDAYDVIKRARDSEAGIPRPELDNLQIAVGNALEDTILSEGCKLLGLDPDEIGTHSHKEAKKHPLMELYYSDDGLYSIDEEEPMSIDTDADRGIFVMTRNGSYDISGKVVFEAKFTTASPSDDGPPLFRGPIQLQAGMMCHGADTGILFTLYGGRKLTAHIYPAHRDTQTHIKRAVVDFEKHMKDGTWPLPHSPEEAAKLFPQPEESEPELELGPDYVDAVLNYRAAEEAIKNAEEIKQTNATKLMSALGNYSAGSVFDGKTTYQVKWPVRNYKGKEAEQCPKCNHVHKPATEARSVRQKSISIKESKNV
tara:strand:+ start:453 stop:1457 length:1005 start_codon:yes stop_codon:yes gene_type:complete